MLRVRLVLFACLACFAWGCAETQHPGDESASSDDVPRHTKHRSKKKKKKVAHKSDDDEDAPKKKKKSSDDDDDDAPKKKVAAKKHSDDDEDDAPKKKPPAKKVVAKHSDDDEDDAPKKKPAPKVVAKHSDDDEDDEPKKKPPAKKIVAKKSSDDDEDEAPKKPRNPHSELVDDKPKKVAAKHAIDDEPKISDDDEDEKPKAKPVAKAKPKAKSEDDDLPRSVLKARAKAKAEEDEDEKPKPVAVKAKHTSDDEEDEKPKPKPVAVKAKAKSDDEEDKPKKAVAKAKPKSDDEEDKPKKTVAKAKSDDEEDKPKPHVEEKHEDPPPEEPPKKQRSIEEDIAVDDPLATLPPKRAVASSEEEAGGEEEETTVTGQAAAAPTKHGEVLQDRSLTTPAGQLDLHAGLPINVLTTTDAMGVSSSATSEGLALGVAYGVNGKAELGFDYTLGLSPGSIKGPATAHAAYSFAKGKLDFAAAAALGIDFFDTVDPVAMTTASNTAASLQLGAWVRYHATPTVSIFSGLPGLPNASASLSKLAFALPVLSYQIQIGLSDKGSSALTLPIGFGYQASPKLYTFASLNLANIRIANTSNAFLFKDYIPIAIGGFYTFDTFSLGASFADDLKQGFGYLRFELVARYLLH